MGKSLVGRIEMGKTIEIYQEEKDLREKRQTFDGIRRKGSGKGSEGFRTNYKRTCRRVISAEEDTAGDV